MKHAFFYLLFAMAGIVFLASLQSCQKSAEFFNPAVSEKGPLNKASINDGSGISVNKGWLNFPSMTVFQATMRELHNKYLPTTLRKWDAGFKGYTSLRKFYEDNDRDTSNNRRMPTTDSLIHANKLLDCPDSWFATVISKEGFIQIADTVYSFKPGQKNGEAYAVPAKFAADLRNGKPAARIKGSKLHYTSFRIIPFPRWPDLGPVYPGPKRFPICLYPAAAMLNWWGQKGGDIYQDDNGYSLPQHNGRTVKLNYHRWRVGYIFYASVGVRLKMWKHTRFAGWLSNTNAEDMIMEACTKGKLLSGTAAPVSFSISTSPSWPGFNSQWTNKFEKTLQWTSSPVFSEIFLDHFNFHFKVDYRGHIMERTIRE